MNRRDLMILAAALGAAGLPALAESHEPMADGAAEAGTDGAAEMAADAPAVEIPEIAVGDEGAPVTVVEYASFTCPHCRRFAEDVYPTIKAEYVDTGKVRFVYREVFFDRYGLWAAMVARCAGTDRYMAVADMIFAKQSEWTQGEPAEVADNLRRLGLSAGLTKEELDACLSDGATAEALVANYEKNAAADDIRATPSFVVNGEPMSNMGLDEMRKRLDAAVEAAS